jgi:hypothetical protein
LKRDGEGFMSYEQLVEGATYVMGGGFYDAMEDDKTRRKSDDKVLEVEGAEAVKQHVKVSEGGDVHLHLNVQDFIKKGGSGQSMEIDGVVVHHGNQNTADSTAYVIESAHAPQEGEVQKLLQKVEKFKVFAQSSDHFCSCTKFVAVLVGKNWSNAKTVNKCSLMNVWRVQPGGGRFQVIRSFAVLLRRMKF